MSWKRPPARTKQYEGTCPDAPRQTVVAVSIATAMDGPPPAEKPKARGRRSDDELWGQRIRDSARGEQCTVRYPGVCNFDPEKTIWSHARWGAQLGDDGRGMSMKATDLLGCYCCSDCDAAFDQHRGAAHLTRDQLDLDWMMGHLRSLGILARKGLL